jgi:phage/plasmid-associated DNA primase
MRTGELLPHDPAHYLTSAIESDYIRDRPCPEVFLNFITSAFGEDQLDAVRAYTSMLIDPTAPYGKFIHIIGPSGSGKELCSDSGVKSLAWRIPIPVTSRNWQIPNLDTNT